MLKVDGSQSWSKVLSTMLPPTGGFGVRVESKAELTILHCHMSALT